MSDSGRVGPAATNDIGQRRRRVPDRWLPVAYLCFAHACLLTAFLALAVRPASLAGFYYHPKLIAVVHLVTLGWITGSILGVLHIILPMALRTPLPAGRSDRWVFWAFVVGVLGMVSHFWIDETSGMVWSAGLVVAAIARVGWRVGRALATAPIPFEHRLPFLLAFANIALAGVLGMLIGIDKYREFLPGFTLHHVAAHAHLAALGWATFMVMGAAYRLLPMLLPSAVPRGRGLIAGSLLTETGVLALTGLLWVGSNLAVLAAALFVAGTALFLDRVRWMLSHPRPAPRDLTRPDYGLGHIASSFGYLVLSVAVGTLILLRPEAAQRPWWILGYGALGLIGFLSQMVIGVSVRLLPLFAWMRQFSGSGFEKLPPSPHHIIVKPLHRLLFWCWTLGTPLLAGGLAFDRLAAVRIGAATLSLAVVASLAQLSRLLRRHPSTPVVFEESG